MNKFKTGDFIFCNNSGRFLKMHKVDTLYGIYYAYVISPLPYGYNPRGKNPYIEVRVYCYDIDKADIWLKVT